MANGYLLIDGNSLGHYYNNSKKLTIGNTEVQAIFGFLRGLRAVIATHPAFTPIIAWDGASWRKMLEASYKENRDRANTRNEIKLLQAKDSYKKQAPYIRKALGFLGVNQISALNMEADDLLAILADRYAAAGSKVIVMSGDKDLLQLVGPNVSWKDPINDRVVTAANFAEFTGVETTQQFVEVKALMGDSGDNVPGVGGIGEKGAVDFIKTYNSFSEFTNACLLDKSINVAKLPKKYRALIEDEDKAIRFAANIKLMDLRTPYRPTPINLRVDKGEPDAAKFRQFCDVLLFQSITQELDEWLRVFPAFRNLDLAFAA